MADYTLHEDQREVVETALLVYREELKKLLKNAVKNRVDTRDIENKLTSIVGDDEDAGLLLVFAREVPEQKDAFYDRHRGREVDEVEEEGDGTEALVEEMYGAEDEPEDEVVDGITDDSEVALEEVIVEAEKEAGKKQEHAFRGVVPTADPYAPDDEPQKPAESAEDDGVPAHLRDVPVIERTCLVCLEDYGADGVCPDCGDVASWAKDTAEV